MGDRYGGSDINAISIGIWIRDMCYQYGIRYINMFIYHIDIVILDIDMGDEANDMGDDRIDTVISHIDMGYLVPLLTCYDHLPGHAGDAEHLGVFRVSLHRRSVGTDIMPAASKRRRYDKVRETTWTLSLT